MEKLAIKKKNELKKFEINLMLDEKVQNLTVAPKMPKIPKTAVKPE